jgi:hypothetical protein
MPIPLVIFLILFLFLFAYSSHFFLLSQNLVSLPSFFSFPQKKYNRVTITLQILSAKWRLRLSLPGGLGREFFTPTSTFFDKLSAFPIKDEGRHFPSDIKGFLLISSVGIFFYCL